MAKVTLSLEILLWRAFRIACINRGTSASKEFTRFMREQLEAWQQEHKVKTDE